MSNPHLTNPSPPGSSEPLNNPPLTTISKESNALQIEEESQDNNREELHKKAEDFCSTCMELLENIKEKQQNGVINMGKIMASMDFLQQTITTEIIPELVEMIQKEELAQIQKDAFSFLAKIYCGDSLKLLELSKHKDQEKAVNTIGIIAERQKFQDIILTNGAFKLLMEILNEAQEAKIEMVLEKGTLALASLCSGQNIDVSEVKSAAVIVLKIANQFEDPKIIYSTLIALSCFPGYYVDTEFPLQPQTYLPFIKHLHSSDTQLVIWILKVLVDVPRCWGTSELFETSEIIEKFFRLLEHEEEKVRRKALRIINEKPLPDNQFMFIINNPQYIKKLIQIGSKDTFKVRSKAILILFHLAYYAEVDELVFLAEIGVVRFLYELTKREEDEELCVQGGIEREERRQIIQFFSIVEQRKAEIERPFKGMFSSEDIY